MTQFPDERGAPLANPSEDAASEGVGLIEVLDEKHVAQLLSLKIGGKKTLFHELCSIMLRESPVRLENIRSALKANNLDSVAKLAHASVGSAASVGARQLQSQMRALEESAVRGDLEQVRSCFDSVEKAWSRLTLAIETRLEQEKGIDP